MQLVIATTGVAQWLSNGISSPCGRLGGATVGARVA